MVSNSDPHLERGRIIHTRLAAIRKRKEIKVVFLSVLEEASWIKRIERNLLSSLFHKVSKYYL